MVYNLLLLTIVLSVCAAVRDCNSAAVSVDVSDVHTNIIMLQCNTDKISPDALQLKFEEV